MFSHFQGQDYSVLFSTLFFRNIQTLLNYLKYSNIVFQNACESQYLQLCFSSLTQITVVQIYKGFWITFPNEFHLVLEIHRSLDFFNVFKYDN